MRSFVSQQAHAPRVPAAFDFEHHRVLESGQARMGEEEGDGEAADAVGCKPIRRQPDVGTERDLSAVELGMEPVDPVG